MVKVGEPLTKEDVDEETGRIVFIVYKDSFMVAVSSSVTEAEVIDVLITSLEHLTQKPDKAAIH